MYYDDIKVVNINNNNTDQNGNNGDGDSHRVRCILSTLPKTSYEDGYKL